MIRKLIKTFVFFITFIMIGGVSAYFTLTFVIKSEGSVIVPNLVDKDIVTVLELLTGLGLNTKIGGAEYNQKIPQDYVISQAIPPGTEIKKGRDIRVILSKGARTVPVPDVTGLSERQARIVLGKAGLDIGKISNTYFEAIERSLIITQSPQAGAEIPRAEPVDLLVSLGPEPHAIAMPEIKGLTLDEAILLIEQNNLILNEIKSVPHETAPIDTIVAQYPAAGNRVFTRSPINVTINRMPKNIIGKMAPLSKAKLFRYRLNYGFLKKRIRIILNCFGVSNALYDQYMKPGEEIWLLIPARRNATVFLFENEKLIRAQEYE